MAQIRMLVTLQASGEPDAKNWVTNTFYLDTDELGTSPDYQALAEDTNELWRTTLQRTTAHDRVEVKAYDMDDLEPREPRGTSTEAWTMTPVDVGPREVALCLSYYASRNLPRQRGRLYIGPIGANQMADRPSAAVTSLLVALAEGISGLGGVNVQWVVHSVAAGDYRTVTDYWIDNAWDTQRRRGLDPSARTTGTVNG